MACANFIVVGIMPGGNFQRPGTKFTRHIFIGNHGYFTSQDWHDHIFTDEFLITLILGMHGHRRIAQNRLRAGGRHRDVFIAPCQHIPEIIQLALLFAVFHLQI